MTPPKTWDCGTDQGSASQPPAFGKRMHSSGTNLPVSACGKEGLSLIVFTDFHSGPIRGEPVLDGYLRARDLFIARGHVRIHGGS